MTTVLRQDQDLQAVIVLSAPEEELRCPPALRGREDDTPDVIRRRLQIYRSSQPTELSNYYADLIVQVDGTGAVDDVHARIVARPDATSLTTQSTTATHPKTRPRCHRAGQRGRTARRTSAPPAESRDGRAQTVRPSRPDQA